jgi:HSP20 family protein
MNLIQWDPGTALQRLRADTDRLWDEYLDKLRRNESDRNPIAFLPDVDFVETGREFRLYLSIPGLIEEDIDLMVDQQILTIRGERQPPYDPSLARSRLREWRYGFFERRIELPHPIQTGALRATYDAGVLTIVVPKV